MQQSQDLGFSKIALTLDRMAGEKKEPSAQHPMLCRWKAQGEKGEEGKTQHREKYKTTKISTKVGEDFSK